jgi:hypothetical protein
MRSGGALAATALALACGCDAKSANAPVDASAGDACAPIATPASDGGTTRWFAVKRIRLGLTQKGSIPPRHDVNAWKSYGFDLDRRNTTADDSKNGTDTCQRVAGAPSGMLTDGYGGIDNGFGGHLMQVVAQLASSTEEGTNAAVTSGARSYLFRIDGAPSAGTRDTPSAPGTLYVAQGLAGGGAPKFDQTDHWHVATVAGRPRGLALAAGFVGNGYWVSSDFYGGCAPRTDASLPLFIGGIGELDLPSKGFVTTFKLGDGSDGTIAGVLPSAAFTEAFFAAAGLDPGSSTAQQLRTTLTQSCDLVLDGPQFQDPTRTCDAISFAIGFELAEAGEPAPDDVPFVRLAPSAFADAGTDGEVGADAGSDGGADATDATDAD